MSSRHFTQVNAHLAAVSFRHLDEIEQSSIVARVIADGAPAVRRVSLRRRASALATLVFIALNAFNLSNGLRRSLAPQVRLAARARDGTLAADSWACSREAAPDFWLKASARDAAACERLGVDARAGITALLVWTEALMLFVTLAAVLAELSVLSRARTDGQWSSGRWQSVSRGFESLTSLATLSALRVLPRLKTAPAEAFQKYKVRRQHRVAARPDGRLRARDTLSTLVWAAGSFAWLVLLTVAGLSALYLKMETLLPVFERPAWRWNGRQWLAFVGFANQIANLTPIARLRKEAFLFFVFTGEDAELQATEAVAMGQFKAMLHMKIFQACAGSGLDAFAAALTITSADLQKIVIKEQHDLRSLVVKEQHAMAFAPPHAAGRTPGDAPVEAASFVGAELRRRVLAEGQ